jgi:adenosylcobinamide kinase/adenosylcobinamide-phosphate guanylyltransferase
MKEMYIITGGAFQGKWSYAQEQTGLPAEAFADGGTAGYEEIFHAEGIVNFHLYVRRYLSGQEEKELEAFAQRLYEENPDLVLVTDEVGSGIVPMDPEERVYRETVGRTCTFLARRAQRVDRVVCGIGMVLQLKPDTDGGKQA